MRSILVAEITATKLTKITYTDPTHLKLSGIIWLRINLFPTTVLPTFHCRPVAVFTSRFRNFIHQNTSHNDNSIQDIDQIQDVQSYSIGNQCKCNSSPTPTVIIATSVASHSDSSVFCKTIHLPLILSADTTLAGCHVHFPSRFTRQYSFAMYTRCIHRHIKI